MSSTSFGRPPRRAVPAAVASLLAFALVAALASPAVADGIEWDLRSSAANNDWFSVAYGVVTATGKGLWVATAISGTGDRVMTSPDGITWTSRASAADNRWISVAYGDGLWVAVATTGTGNRVMTSADPACTPVAPATSCWTAQASVVDNDWWSVAYGGGLWVATAVSGTGNRVMTSPDGITWTIGTSAADSNWTSVAYGNGRWVAVANQGASGTRAMTSLDGFTWTVGTSAADIEWFSVAYGDGLWVAVASTGTVDRVMTSTDGAGWTLRAAATGNAWRSVAYGDGLWVAVARNGTGNGVMTSTDPACTPVSPATSCWTSRTSAANIPWNSVAYGNGLWVAVASLGALNGTGNGVMTSGVMLEQVALGSSRDTPTPPALSCSAQPARIDTVVNCTVTGGDPRIDILWRAAFNPVFAEAGVTLDETGSGEFSFVVPAAALGEEVTVELVEWLAPVSLGVVGGPVPSSVPSGGGPLPVWSIVLLALAGGLVLRRMSAVGVRG